MEISSVSVKKTAKAALCGHWTSSCTATAALIGTYIVCAYASSMISNVFSFAAGSVSMLALYLFIIFPLFMGTVRFFRTLIWGAKAEISDIFVYFSSLSAYRRILAFAIGLISRLALCAAVVFLPAAAVKLITSGFLYDMLDMPAPLWSESLGTLSIFFIIIGAFCVTWFAFRLYLSPFMLAADDEMTPGEALHMSWVVSKTSMSSFVRLLLSFAGFLLLCILAVPVFFILPYFLCCYTVHSRFAATRYNLTIDRLQTSEEYCEI